MEICPKLTSEILTELVIEQSNILLIPPTLPDITGTVWTINLADRGGELTGSRYGGVESGVIMPLAVPLANGIRMDRVELRQQWRKRYGPY